MNERKVQNEPHLGKGGGEESSKGVSHESWSRAIDSTRPHRPLKPKTKHFFFKYIKWKAKQKNSLK